jgi:hypothetical protein
VKPDADPESDEQLREELEEACENVRRQIDLMQRSKYSKAGETGGDAVIARLRSTLAGLEEALADLGPDDA